VKALIVHAHPEPTSFNARLLDTAVTTLTEAGHEVQVSDLYAMRWDPVASGADFLERRFPDQLQYDREQKTAVAQRTFRADVAEEIEKVVWCDLLVLQFPLWWYSVPAIMKGWFDRVFVNGLMYGALGRFDQGGMAGRRAMVSTTTGAFPGMVGERGVMGHLDAILWHLEYGTLAYSGFTVLERFVGNAVRYVDDETREGYLPAYADHLRRLEELPVMPTHANAEFGPDFALLPDVEPRTLGHSWSRPR
jgi:NAD(P)H dehydrogenase (quinone)